MEHGYLFLGELFRVLGIHDVPMNIAYSWFSMLILITAGVIVTRNLSFVPKGSQNFFEAIISGIENFMVDNMGEHGRFTFPFLATIFIYIFVMNILGLVPGCTSATANVNTNASIAICVFIYTHIIGLRLHGVSYIKHFMGPVPWIAPLMFPIELIGHLARILSLTIRLFGNIMSKEVLLMLLFIKLDVGKYLLPTLPVYVLGIFVSFVQALIFFMLSMCYFSGAIEEAH